MAEGFVNKRKNIKPELWFIILDHKWLSNLLIKEKILSLDCGSSNLRRCAAPPTKTAKKAEDYSKEGLIYATVVKSGEIFFNKSKDFTSCMYYTRNFETHFSLMKLFKFYI